MFRNFTDFAQISLAVRALQKKEPGCQEGRGFRKTDPPTFFPPLSRADTSLCACGSTKKKLNIGRPKLAPSFVSKRRVHRNSAADRRAISVPTFVAEPRYGLANSFHSIFRIGDGLRAGELFLHHPCSDGVARIELKDNLHSLFRYLRFEDNELASRRKKSLFRSFCLFSSCTKHPPGSFLFSSSC